VYGVVVLLDRNADIVRSGVNDILPHGCGVVAMLKLYMDRGSRKEAGRVMCVAAALFEPFHYERFLHEWQPFLDEWGAAAFHATDFYPGRRNTPFNRKNPDGTLNRAKVAQFEAASRSALLRSGALLSTPLSAKAKRSAPIRTRFSE
jgi:hypothetical protein